MSARRTVHADEWGVFKLLEMLCSWARSFRWAVRNLSILTACVVDPILWMFASVAVTVIFLAEGSSVMCCVLLYLAGRVFPRAGALSRKYRLYERWPGSCSEKRFCYYAYFDGCDFCFGYFV